MIISTNREEKRRSFAEECAVCSTFTVLEWINSCFMGSVRSSARNTFKSKSWRLRI